MLDFISNSAWSNVIATILSMINIVLALAVPVVIIYAVYLLRRIAINTSPDNSSRPR